MKFIFLFIFSVALAWHSPAQVAGGNADTLRSAARFIPPMLEAQKEGNYVRMINLYEMIRNCDDYSLKKYPTNWIDVVRKMQEDELRERDSINRILRINNSKTTAGNLALQSLNSEDSKAKMDLAIKAYDSLHGFNDIHSPPGPTVLEAMHKACKSSNRIKFRNGIKWVSQQTDSTCWVRDYNGSYFLLTFDETGIVKSDSVVQVNSMLVSAFAETPNGMLAFGGVYPFSRNRVLVYDMRTRRGLRNVLLPKKVEPVYSMEFVDDNLVMTGSNNFVGGYSLNDSSLQDDFFGFKVHEKITAMDWNSSVLYCGTMSGKIMKWQRDTRTYSIVDGQETNNRETQISRLRVMGDGDGVKIVAGFVDGRVSIFDEKYENWTDLPGPHRDYITELVVSEDMTLLGALSYDGRVSVTKIKNYKSPYPIVLRYEDSNSPVGISISAKLKSLYVFQKDGTIDIVHLDLSYYANRARNNVQ